MNTQHSTEHIYNLTPFFLSLGLSPFFCFLYTHTHSLARSRSLSKTNKTSFIQSGFVQTSVESYQEAHESFEEALRIRICAYGEVHDLVAKTRNNLAVTCLHLNKIVEAKQHLEQAVEIQRCTLADLYNHSDSRSASGTNTNNTNTNTNTTTDECDEDTDAKARQIKLKVANVQCNLGCMLLDTVMGNKKVRRRKIIPSASSTSKDSY